MDAKLPICLKCEHCKKAELITSGASDLVTTDNRFYRYYCNLYETGVPLSGYDMGARICITRKDYDRPEEATISKVFRLPRECPYILEHTVQ